MDQEGGQAGGVRGMGKKVVAKVMPVFDRLTDIAFDDAQIVKREGQLFFGMTFLLVGLFRFQSGKYCDGNAADYLSCTRPATYYYYGGFEIFLLIIGSFLVTLWLLKRRG